MISRLTIESENFISSTMRDQIRHRPLCFVGAFIRVFKNGCDKAPAPRRHCGKDVEDRTQPFLAYVTVKCSLCAMPRKLSHPICEPPGVNTTGMNRRFMSILPIGKSRALIVIRNPGATR